MFLPSRNFKTPKNFLNLGGVRLNRITSEEKIFNFQLVLNNPLLFSFSFKIPSFSKYISN